ncbi:RNA polymerase sigma54 factor [Bacteroidetes bacterium UKL13-3]|jgi:RNA polymerase sigma-54 factor|nr:RNA polymerase sigma54 factor [Bacteroidetes bacterium UKL13-3]HCP92781.1 RNA polymerase sigma-54 factor [Bacteroidota bacterium]
MLKQGLQQKLLQKLSPQQIQFIKLLQLNTVDLQQRIDDELIENPALVKSEDEDAAAPLESDIKEAETADDGQEDNVSVEDYLTDETLDIKEYVNDDYDSEGFHLSDEGPDDDKKEMPLAETTSFHELLAEQFNAIAENEREQIMGNQIIGTIDDDGYLRRPLEAIQNDLAFSQNIEASIDELKTCLVKIQALEPAGIAATSLQECLLLQLKRKDHARDGVRIAEVLLRDYFDDFTKKHYEKLTRSLKITDEQLKDAIKVITHLNPKPGESVSDSKPQYITPDFILVENEGKLEVLLNSRNAPDLRISRSYMETLKAYDKTEKPGKELKQTVQFIKQKLDGAKWFIDSIKQRQNTLLMTMNAILQQQYAYFETGDETKMRPMILKDIAEKVGMDISTISRVANSKYVQTDFGTIPLKFFFSEGIATDDGEEVSSREVKRILKDAIEAEDKHKPLPDEKLMEILKDKGYNIARRTVAKYREQLNIPVARLRKEV